MILKTGVLGSIDATLGNNLTLGAIASQGDLVSQTPGLVVLYKFDDLSGQSVIQAYNNPSLNATVNLGGTAYTAEVLGIDHFGIQTPIAPNTGSHVYDTAQHLSFDYTGSAFNIGNAGTIELWFKPLEYGDEIAPGSPLTPDPGRDYEILRVTSTAQDAVIIFRTGWLSHISPLAFNIRPYFSGASWDGNTSHDLGVTFATTPGVGTTFADFTTKWPLAEIGRWYYLVLTWDSGGYAIYTDGLKVHSDTIHPPSGFDDCNISFGQSGGVYDLLSITNRKMTEAEIAFRFAPGAADPPATTHINVTSFYANYAASFLDNVNVTAVHKEILRSSVNNTRVTATHVEVLRSVLIAPVEEPALRQFISFTETVTGVFVPSVLHPSLTQTLAFNETLVGTAAAPKLVTQTLSFTQTATFRKLLTPITTEHVTDTLTFTQAARRAHITTTSQTLTFTPTLVDVVSHLATNELTFTQTVTTHMVRNRSILQLLPLTDSDGLPGSTHNTSINDTLNFLETISFGHIRSTAGLQTLLFTETLTTQLVHIYHEALTDTLTFNQTADIRYGKQGTGTNVLLFVERVNLTKIYHRTITDHLVFTETIPKLPRTFARGITDWLVFYDHDIPTQLPLYIDGVPVQITLPVVTITKITKTVILQSKSGAVVLPVPEFNDTDESGDTINLKRTMTGIFYTYVKTSQTRILNYDFVLGRAKALELRRFVAVSLSQLIYLQNWKGELYVGQFVNNPVSFVTAGRYAKGGERVTVTLNFEGIRLS